MERSEGKPWACDAVLLTADIHILSAYHEWSETLLNFWTPSISVTCKMWHKNRSVQFSVCDK